MEDFWITWEYLSVSFWALTCHWAMLFNGSRILKKASFYSLRVKLWKRGYHSLHMSFWKEEDSWVPRNFLQCRSWWWPYLICLIWKHIGYKITSCLTCSLLLVKMQWSSRRTWCFCHLAAPYDKVYSVRHSLNLPFFVWWVKENNVQYFPENCLWS